MVCGGVVADRSRAAEAALVAPGSGPGAAGASGRTSKAPAFIEANQGRVAAESDTVWDIKEEDSRAVGVARTDDCIYEICFDWAAATETNSPIISSLFRSSDFSR